MRGGEDPVLIDDGAAARVRELARVAQTVHGHLPRPLVLARRPAADDQRTRRLASVGVLAQSAVVCVTSQRTDDNCY